MKNIVFSCQIENDEKMIGKLDEYVKEYKIFINKLMMFEFKVKELGKARHPQVLCSYFGKTSTANCLTEVCLEICEEIEKNLEEVKTHIYKLNDIGSEIPNIIFRY